MCGLVGVYSRTHPADAELLEKMSASLRHRGPDDSGTWTRDGLGLAHRRLSVVDLSAAGHQPMHSRSGRWVICYNGEIYNTETLRERLPHTSWRGHSDTEVIVQACECWGVEQTVQALTGMFAFAAYDTERRELWLARDRLGIKPLYYGWLGERFAFASELSALRHVHSPRPLDPSAVRSFLRYGYVPAPHSIYHGVFKLPPGHIAKLPLTPAAANGTNPQTQCYWSYQEHACQPRLELSEAEATDQLHALLRRAVKDRLVADVPLGAFLSGGYDSSLVCALMQEQSGQPANTFTIGFDNPAYNEAEHARRIAGHLGTQHTELYVSAADMLQAVQQLPQLCDEPFADSSILPTYLVSRLARRQVTVSLSGDGGDELFWGYHRYATSLAVWNKIARFPGPLRKAVEHLARNKLMQTATRRVPVPGWGGRPGMLNQKLLRVADLIGAGSHHEQYHRMMCQWLDPDQLLAGADHLNAYNNPAHWTAELPAEQRMAAQDLLVYLPDDILTKVDRASMAVSLEARVPLLDHRVVEFSARLPDHLKNNGGTSKYLLRKVLAEYVPAELTDRPKMGFGVPLADWLRGPLKDWAGDLLAADTILRQGLLNPQPVTDLWQEHQRGHSDNSARLWFVLMLQLWMQHEH